MIQYIKQFDFWNRKKKGLDHKIMTDSFYYHEREVWWCSVGVNVGVEIDGKNNDFERPVLVVKKFNTHMFWGIPLTSKFKEHRYMLRIEHEAGTSYANLSQLRLFSSKRMLRKIGMISQDSFHQILISMMAMFGVDKKIEPQ